MSESESMSPASVSALGGGTCSSAFLHSVSFYQSLQAFYTLSPCVGLGARLRTAPRRFALHVRRSSHTPDINAAVYQSPWLPRRCSPPSLILSVFLYILNRNGWAVTALVSSRTTQLLVVATPRVCLVSSSFPPLMMFVCHTQCCEIDDDPTQMEILQKLFIGCAMGGVWCVRMSR